ncbi:MAG: ribonuclease H-like domain-containing protein [bacterium]|nr:ribonuclease H-like domain-containing protein [bacterium]
MSSFDNVLKNSGKKLIIDIETVGEDFDSLDEFTKDSLTKWIKKEAENETEYQKLLEELKNRLGFSPLTAQIVVIGLLDYEKKEGVVYFDAPGENIAEFKDSGITFKQATEKEMLSEFWRISNYYNYFITFNGRNFDIPFIMIRSAICGIKPSKDLMRGRYIYQQSLDAIHIDLAEQLSFYGALRKKGSLHLWSRAFGIESPKNQGVTGDDVGKLYSEGKYLDIARYNVLDLKATAELFSKWDDYLNI